MNKAILAFFFIFNLYTTFSKGVTGSGLLGPSSGVYGGDVAKDFIDKWAGDFINSTTATTDPMANPLKVGKKTDKPATPAVPTNIPTQPDTPFRTVGQPSSTTVTTTTTTTVSNYTAPVAPVASGAGVGVEATTNLADFGAKAFYSNFTCPQAINKTSQAVNDLAKAAVNATDLFSLYGKAQKLNGMSEFLNYGCDLAGYKLVNTGITGLNVTQDEACQKLIEVISPLVDPSSAGLSPADYTAALTLSQEVFGLTGSLGNECNITLVGEAKPVGANPAANPWANTGANPGANTGLPPGTESSPGFEMVKPSAITYAVPFANFVQAKLTYLRKLM